MLKQLSIYAENKKGVMQNITGILKDEDINILVSWIGDFKDTAKGKELAVAQAGQGADVIFSVAGIAGLGTLAGCAESNIYSIGVDSDQYTVLLETDPTTAANICTSMYKKADVTVSTLIAKALDGTLDAAFEAMAASGEMSAAEYKTYYQTGYRTDISGLSIQDDHIEFTYTDGKKVGSDYRYVGYFIQNWSTGTKAAMYRFEAVDPASGAPEYIEFNDHMIAPAAAEHFHLRMSNESFDAIVDPEASWPTLFPADMTGDEVCEHMAGHDHEEHEEEMDEHVWLSLKNAQVLCDAISQALQAIDPENKEAYAANAEAYEKQLSALDEKYQEAVDNATYKTLLFGDRFPFRYLTDDYGLRYYAAFSGCSAESEASFETILFLAKKLDELGLPCILTIEGVRHKIAQTIVENTARKNQSILALDSMQSTTSKDVAQGTAYLSVMEKNLDVLTDALG